jgi:hypothetical protein
MRRDLSGTFASLVLLLSAGLLWAADRRNPAPPPPAAAADSDDDPWVVRGSGQTVADADKDALNQAAEKVRQHLAESHPELGGWVPTPDFLTQNGAVKKIGSPKEFLSEFSGPVWIVKMRVDLGQPQIQKMLTHAREQRMQGRHRLAAWVLLGAVLLLGVAMGYLRVEDATRGHLTGTLRVVTALVGSAIIAGIWWFAR